MSLAHYPVNIPDTAAIAGDWDTLRAEAHKYPWRMLEAKYGGIVIKVDVVIKVATTDEMTKLIAEKMASLPPDTKEDIAEVERRERHLIEYHMPPEERERLERERHPALSSDPLREAYTDCPICRSNQPS